MGPGIQIFYNRKSCKAGQHNILDYIGRTGL